MSIRPNSGDRDVNVNDKNQVAYWTKRLGVSKSDLKVAVRKVGRSPHLVQEYFRQAKHSEIERLKEVDRRVAENRPEFVRRIEAAVREAQSDEKSRLFKVTEPGGTKEE